MDVRVVSLLARQRDLVAAWQLMRLGWTRKAVRHHATHDGWRAIHDGVFALTQAPLTDDQVRMAATLTAPHTFLSDESAGAHYGICRQPACYQTVVREGSRGRHRMDGVLVRYSKTLT